MCDIYRNSSLTISAACSASDLSGFLWETPPQARVNHEDMLSSDPIHTRAWTFQETLLPRRLLSFGSCEMYWECERHKTCQCGRIDSYETEVDGRRGYRQSTSQIIKGHHYVGKEEDVPIFSSYCIGSALGCTERELQDVLSGVIPDDSSMQYAGHEEWIIYKDDSKAHIKAFYKYWRCTLVPVYTQRKLSKFGDKLIALQAIATDIQSGMRDDYLAGLWRGDLRRQLCWVSLDPKAIATGNGSPSWSWASISGPVGPYREQEGRRTRFADIRTMKILDASCSAAGSNRCGKTSNGKLVVSGSAFRAFLSLDPGSGIFSFRVSSWDDTTSWPDNLPEFDINFSPDTALSPGRRQNVTRRETFGPSRAIPWSPVVLYAVSLVAADNPPRSWIPNTVVLLVLSAVNDLHPSWSTPAYSRIGIGYADRHDLTELTGVSEYRKIRIV